MQSWKEALAELSDREYVPDGTLIMLMHTLFGPFLKEGVDYDVCTERVRALYSLGFEVGYTLAQEKYNTEHDHTNVMNRLD